MPARAQVVLDRDRHAGQRTRVVAPRDRGVDRVGRGARLVGKHEVERVDLRLARVDRGEVLLEHVARAARDRRGRRPAISDGASRRLAEDARHPEAAVFDRGRGRQHLVAVEAGRTSSGRSTFTSGSGCAVGWHALGVERRDLGRVVEDRARARR